MGSPSRVNGALRTTAGVPSGSRTTTSNAAVGSRPSWARTASTSAVAGVTGGSLGTGRGGLRRGRQRRGRGGGGRRDRRRGGDDHVGGLPRLDQAVLLAGDAFDGRVGLELAGLAFDARGVAFELRELLAGGADLAALLDVGAGRVDEDEEEPDQREPEEGRGEQGAATPDPRRDAPPRRRGPRGGRRLTAGVVRGRGRGAPRARPRRGAPGPAPR